MEERYNISKSLLVGCLILVLLVSSALSLMEYRYSHVKAQALMSGNVSEMSAQVEQSLLQVYCFQGYVLGAEGRNVDLAHAAPELLHEEINGEFVHNVLVAPEGVVSQVYPGAGNEGMLEFDLLSEDNAGSKDARRAYDTGNLVVSGPYSPNQDGQVVSAYLGVQLPNEEGVLAPWGLVSLTLAFPDVLKVTGADDLAEIGYCYRVSSFDAQSASYVPSFENDFVETTDVESTDFSIESMKFRLEAYPARGWILPWHIAAIFLLSSVVIFPLGVVMGRNASKRKILRERASTDGLTGLVNREVGRQQIDRYLASASNSRGIFLIVDVDNFKQVNDTLGHQKGDEVLRDAARILKQTFRSSDVVGRLGGDEFFVFMGYGETRNFLSDRITSLVSAMRRSVEGENGVVNLSCSVGVACSPEDGNCFDELYENADKALYHAKESGRNRAVYCEMLRSDSSRFSD